MPYSSFVKSSLPFVVSPAEKVFAQKPKRLGLKKHTPDLGEDLSPTQQHNASLKEDLNQQIGDLESSNSLLHRDFKIASVSLEEAMYCIWELEMQLKRKTEECESLGKEKQRQIEIFEGEIHILNQELSNVKIEYGNLQNIYQQETNVLMSSIKSLTSTRSEIQAKEHISKECSNGVFLVGGELHVEKESSFKKFTWTIHNFHALAELRDFCFSSPSFSFNDSLFNLSILRNMLSPGFGPGDVILSLRKMPKNVMGDQLIYWKLCIENLHTGTNHLLTVDGVLNFHAANLQTEDVIIGSSSYVKKHFVVDDCMRVYCELCLVNGGDTADASSQTQLISRTDILVQDMKGLLLSGDSSDATIMVRGQKFHVHRSVLGARSPIFFSMFRHEMSEKILGVVNIDDCDPDTFRNFLDYIYSGEVEYLAPKNAVHLYKVAHKYQIDELKAECVEYIIKGVSISSFCDTLTLALTHNESALIKLAIEFFKDHMKEIILTVEWQTFLSENPTQSNELFIKALGNYQKMEK